MKNKFRLSFHCLFALLLFPLQMFSTLGDPSYVSHQVIADGFAIVGEAGEPMTSIVVESGETLGVKRAAKALQKDVERVTGKKLELSSDPFLSQSDTCILIGTIHQSTWIDPLIETGKLDVTEIQGEWEGTLIQLIDAPFKGVKKALVIIGSDRRGTAFGVYDLCEQMGVSPWHFWLDSYVDHHEHIYVKPVRKVSKPEVKYRGIFLNDEAPALSGWVRANWDTYNHEFYEHIFDLLVRLKSNFLWPAMWGNAFGDDDPKNVSLAHDFGIFMSTSHHEPMMRADREWDRHGEGPWDYSRNPEKLRDFWREGAERYRERDCVFTLGMRGQNDTPMSENENIGLLETIVHDQRDILSDVFGAENLIQVPQVWCLYKEVQSYYENGMRVPDDVTLLWSDDNWGNIRRLPTPDERTRVGGAGVYYHFDYVGDPRSYRWMNVTQNAKVWEQMDLAYQYDARKIWVVNVGDLKPMEYPIEFFLRMAYQPEAWPKERVQDFGRLFFEREFGPQHAQQMLDIVNVYTRQNARRRSELLEPGTFSIVNYNEGDRILEELHAAQASAESLYELLPEEKQDTFDQLVRHPIRSVVNVNEIAIYGAKNRLFAEQRRISTNDYADKVEAAFQADRDLMEQFHTTLADGKWHHFMSQPHIGYVYWNNPPEDNMPWVARVRPTDVAYLGVATAASRYAHPDERFNKTIPEMSPYGSEKQWIDVFNIGKTAFYFTSDLDCDWVKLSQSEGDVEKEVRIFVSIDWEKAPKGRSVAKLRIHPSKKGYSWGRSAEIRIPIFNPEDSAVEGLKGFVEAEGYISIEAENFTAQKCSDSHQWEVIEEHGHTVSSVSVFPRDDTVYLKTEDAPKLEYDFHLFSEGEIEVECRFAPTLNFVPGRGLRYAIAVDGQEPQIVDILANSQHRDWQEAVRLGMRKSLSSHSIQAAGNHTLKVWAVDPGVVLQNIIIDTGGLQQSYLGPQESYRAF